MKGTFFRAFLWALFVLVVITAYYSSIFFLRVIDELQAGSYGALVYIKYAWTAGAAMSYNAWPFAVLIFCLFAFRSPGIKQRISTSAFISICLAVGVIFFWWFAFRNPVLYKAHMSLLFDIRAKVPPNEFGKYDSLIDLPAVMNYNELNTEIDASLRKYDLSGSVNAADVQYREFIERNIAEARDKRNTMLIYPLVISLMCAIGWIVGPLTQSVNWAWIPLIVIAGVFPMLGFL